MPQFSLHELQGGQRVVNLQSDFLDFLQTRLVAPLQPSGKGPTPAKHLNPVFTLQDGEFVLIIQSVAAVPVVALGHSIGDLSAERDKITRALDMVFQGF